MNVSSERLHVLFVTGEFPPMVGGVGAYTKELANALHHQGVQVTILTAPQAATVQQEGNFSVLSLAKGWGWNLLTDIPRCAVDIGADWVHIQYQTAAFGMHPAINCTPFFLTRALFKRDFHRFRELRSAWTYHDLLVPYLFPKAGARLRNWITRLPSKFADALVVTNEEDRRALDNPSVSNRLYRIPIGSNIKGQQFTDQQRTERRTHRGFTDHQLVLGYFGFLNASKGGLTLIQTLAELVARGRDAHLLMIGERVGASDRTNYRYMQQVEAQIERLGLAGRVSWTGYEPDPEVAADLNAIDVLVMPYEDGVSLRRGTFMAGLANGCAVVTTYPQTRTPELTANNELLLIPPDDPVSAANAVLQIADDPALAHSLRANARKASRRFHWDVIASQHLAFYTR